MVHPLPATKSDMAASINFLAITFCVHSIVAAGLWLLFRFEDSGIRQQVIGMLCYSLAFFGAVSFSYRRYLSTWVLPVHIIALMLIPSVLSSTPIVGFWIVLGLGFVGLASLVLALVEDKCALSFGKCLLVVTISFLCGICHFLVPQVELYSTVFSDLRTYARVDTTLIVDTMFHSAIIRMLREFNIPSTGLDGLPSFFYHVGIHRWIAANLDYLSGEPMTLLGGARDILWVPIFLFSLSFSMLTASSSAHWLRALLIAVLGNLIYCRIKFPSHLTSESYLLSLPIFVSFMPIGLGWLENYYMKNSSIPRSALFKQVFVSSLAIILCWIAKMSTGLIMACCLVGFLVVPRFLERPRRWLKISIISCIVVVCLLFLIKQSFLPAYDFKLFAYYIVYPSFAVPQTVVFLSLLLIFWMAPRELQGETKLRSSVLLLMVSIFLIGQIPGFLFDIGGASATFFSEPTVWLAYFLVSSVVLMRIQGIKQLQLIASAPKSTSSISGTSVGGSPDASKLAEFEFSMNPKVIYIAFWIAVGLTVFNFYKNLPYQFYINVMQPTNAEVKQALSLENSPLSLDVPQEKKGSAWDKFARFKQRLVPGKIALMKHTELGRIQSIAKNLVTDKKATVIYVPPDAPFWNNNWNNTGDGITPEHVEVVCWSKSFAIPALTGMPMLNGVRSGVEDCPVTQYYGMTAYTDDSLNRKLDSKELCQRARKLGFKNVLEIKPDNYQVHVCNGE
jgi:hypothetical protein